jgi:hypothetical protein
LLGFGISAQQADTPLAPSDFMATVLNPSAAPKAPPQGMVWIPGGEFSSAPKPVAVLALPKSLMNSA